MFEGEEERANKPCLDDPSTSDLAQLDGHMHTLKDEDNDKDGNGERYLKEVIVQRWGLKGLILLIKMTVRSY
jgi:hypothetical protein